MIPWAQKGWGSRWRKVGAGGGKAACTTEKLITKERRDHWSISKFENTSSCTGCWKTFCQNSLSVGLNSLPTVLYKKLEESQPPRLFFAVFARLFLWRNSWSKSLWITPDPNLSLKNRVLSIAENQTHATGSKIQFGDNYQKKLSSQGR